jgi:hypothetical protein
MVEEVTDRSRSVIRRDGKVDRQAKRGSAATACNAHSLANSRETAQHFSVAESRYLER